MGKWDILRGPAEDGADKRSEEQQGIAQPALEVIRGQGTEISLPTDFENVIVCRDILRILEERRSVRRYSEQPLSLAELSFVLWCTQGTKKIVGRSKSPLRGPDIRWNGMSRYSGWKDWNRVCIIIVHYPIS